MENRLSCKHVIYICIYLLVGIGCWIMLYYFKADKTSLYVIGFIIVIPTIVLTILVSLIVVCNRDGLQEDDAVMIEIVNVVPQKQYFSYQNY